MEYSRKMACSRKCERGRSPSGNITFPLVIPDLSIDSVTTPITADPGSFVTLQGTISNPSIVATEAQRFFRIEASIVGSGITESIIFPDPDNFPANSPWPIQPNVPLTFTIPNFYIPPTSTGTVQYRFELILQIRILYRVKPGK